MSVRKIKRRLPRPQEYTVSASMTVPEYVGPFGWPMTTVRITAKGSFLGNHSHSACVARLMAGRDAYLAGVKEDGNA